MDLRGLYQKIDVDSIRAKFPQISVMPTMPQIKLPKSMPKLNTRKIFKSSREDIGNACSPNVQHHMQPDPPPTQYRPRSDIVMHTPQRISTITSLMEELDGDNIINPYLSHKANTYRSACSIDDDYPSPRHFNTLAAKPISPVRTPTNIMKKDNDLKNINNPTTIKPSFTERVQKSYKEITDFRLKHIFSKKTIIRKDSIIVDNYVESFNEERKKGEREQERRDEAIADNYRFKFKVSRQNTGHEDSIDSNDSIHVANKIKQQRSMSEQSDDESGLENSPPKRKGGIAATRFANAPPLRKYGWSNDEEHNGYKEQHIEFIDKRKALWSTKENRTPVEVTPLKSPLSKQVRIDGELPTQKKVTYKHRVRTRFSNMGTSYESATETVGEARAKVYRKFKKMGKKSNDREKESTEDNKNAKSQNIDNKGMANTVTDKSMAAIKKSIKRIQKSIKRSTVTQTDDSADGDKSNKPKDVNKTDTLASRLHRFKSQNDIPDATSINQNDDGNNATATAKSPLHTMIGNKIQAAWNKSFKKRTVNDDETKAHSDDETRTENHKRSDTLIKKLRSIRNRKTQYSTDEIEKADEEKSSGMPDNNISTQIEAAAAAAATTTTTEGRFQKVRKRTLKKVNDTMQQMKIFQTSQEQNVGEGNDVDSEVQKTKKRQSTYKKGFRHAFEDYRPHYCDDIADIEEIHQQCASNNARAAWTTKSLLSKSIDSGSELGGVEEEEGEGDFARILIHQDNSNAFESTLVIAVTRPSSFSSRYQSPPTITEIPPEKTRINSPSIKSNEWVPNDEIISGFLALTTPVTGQNKSEKVEEIIHSSTAEIHNMPEIHKPSKIIDNSKSVSEKLYKTKSIDIFPKKSKIEAVMSPFEDFDDVLKNEPVLKICETTNFDSFEKDGSEDADTPDDDNSSRITKILVNKDANEMECLSKESITKEICNKKIESQNSLPTNYDESEDIDSDNDRPPSVAPSPPPSMSPPPPPLPIRKASILLNKTVNSTVKEVSPPVQIPALPQSKPPIIPERTASINRTCKPLVKTSSLRLAYDEQVKPADVGKVNKLISRFEPNTKVMTSQRDRPRIIPRNLSHYESDEYSDEDVADSDDENANEQRDITPTPQKNETIVTIAENGINNNNDSMATEIFSKSAIASSQIPRLTLNTDQNSNLSLPNSEYGSPLEYPSSLVGSAETTPTQDRRSNHLNLERMSMSRSRRSMTRDDDKFLSFDSDEENSYYSISSTGSRYIVEI